MIYSDFKGTRLPLLGYGGMRFPVNEDGSLDEARTCELIDFAMEHGLNYFDTAYPYHGGNSELVLGRALAKYPRESWILASKYPGHQLFSDGHKPAAIFEEQLEKCGVDYFDFYLLHNVYEGSLGTYLDESIGIIEYFIEQRKRGRIKHLGFSTHAQTGCMREFLELYGAEMEFCQIQLNYLDWTLQEGKEKCELLASYGIPVWVMEPLRGGKLAQLDDSQTARLAALRPNEKPAAWAFRFLQDIPNVKMILSGMTTMEQLQENLAAFQERKPLSGEERSLILEFAKGMKDSLPCTSCRYCCPECPQELNIPFLLTAYNDLRFASSFTTGMSIEFLAEDKKPEACIGCGACSRICPQKIDIPEALADLVKRMEDVPSWAVMCKEREEAARTLRKDS